MRKLSSLEILGEALARTFEKFARETPTYHDKKISFDRDTHGEFVDSQTDIGDIRLSSGTGKDSKNDTGVTIYIDEADDIMHFEAFIGSEDKHGIDALSPNQIDASGDDNGQTLAAVASFVQTHFGYAQSDFLNEVAHQIDLIKSDIQHEQKAKAVLDKLRL